MKFLKPAGLPAIALLILIQGCALTPQNLHLDPTIDMTGEAVTADTLIGLSVIDARPTTKLGEVGDPNQEMVSVTLDEDFTFLLDQKVTTALEKRGFSVVPDSGAMTRSLTVEISSLILNSEKRPLDFQTELKSELAAIARNSNEKYERAYYVRTQKITAGPPYEKHSNELVNNAVSQALSDMLNDDKLFEMLAR